MTNKAEKTNQEETNENLRHIIESEIDVNKIKLI